MVEFPCNQSMVCIKVKPPSVLDLREIVRFDSEHCYQLHTPHDNLTRVEITGLLQDVEFCAVKYWHSVKSEASMPARLGILRAIMCLVSLWHQRLNSLMLERNWTHDRTQNSKARRYVGLRIDSMPIFDNERFNTLQCSCDSISREIRAVDTCSSAQNRLVQFLWDPGLKGVWPWYIPYSDYKEMLSSHLKKTLLPRTNIKHDLPCSVALSWESFFF